MNIVKMYFGSRLYGTATQSSDTDIKTVILPPISNCVLNRIPKSINTSTGNDGSKNTNKDIDEEIFSLQYFIELACRGETICIDMLHANKKNIIESSPIWEEIIKHRKRFYTNNLKAFAGYARKQTSIYSQRADRLHTFQQIYNFLKEQNKDFKLQDIWNKLPIIDHVHILDDPKNENIKFFQVNGRKFQSTARIDYVLPILEGFIKEYGDRVKNARNNNSIDFKSLSHAIRVAYEMKEIFETNDLQFPLKNANTILKVKTGKMDFVSEVLPLLDSLMDEIEELSAKSTLPEKVDRSFWDDFIINVYEKEYRKMK